MEKKFGPNSLPERAYASADGRQYVLRSLLPKELDAWASFCASVFSYKAHPPSPSYFMRHFVADPDRQDASWIRVALDGDDQIVSSCRIFFRRISCGQASSLMAAGIGEVCTDVKHRKRGLSKQLLFDSFESIEQAGVFDVSLLHAAETFFGFYRSVGYTYNSVSPWRVVRIRQAALKQSSLVDKDCTIRLAQFPSDTESLMKLHKEYTEDRTQGCIKRSKDYWNDYVSQETAGRLFVLVQTNSETTEDTILGWICLRLRNDGQDTTKLQLCDFGCTDPSRKCHSMLALLLEHAVRDLKLVGNAAEDFRLLLPSLVLEDARLSSDATTFLEFQEEDDHGWMYKPLQFPAKLAQLQNQDAPHLIWPTDSF